MQLRFLGVTVLGAAVLTFSLVAWSKPAPWFWWISQHDGQRVCAQFMPSTGWRQGEGPFTNPQCRPQRATLIHGR